MLPLSLILIVVNIFDEAVIDLIGSGLRALLVEARLHVAELLGLFLFLLLPSQPLEALVALPLLLGQFGIFVLDGLRLLGATADICVNLLHIKALCRHVVPRFRDSLHVLLDLDAQVRQVASAGHLTHVPPDLQPACSVTVCFLNRTAALLVLALLSEAGMLHRQLLTRTELAQRTLHARSQRLFSHAQRLALGQGWASRAGPWLQLGLERRLDSLSWRYQARQFEGRRAVERNLDRTFIRFEASLPAEVQIPELSVLRHVGVHTLVRKHPHLPAVFLVADRPDHFLAW